MKKDWRTVKIGEIVESISKKHRFDKEKVIFLNTSDILNGKVLHNEYTEVETLPGQAKKSIQKNDILFSEIRPANKRFAYIDFDGDDYVVSTKLMVLRPKSPEISSKYLYFYLTSNENLLYLQSVAETRSGTFPQITFSEIKEIEIDLPPIEEQDKIVNIIDNINKKIDLNQKMNETLEALGLAHYRYWIEGFVPFKESNLKDSELGMIPEEWEVKEIGNAVQILGGGTPKTSISEYWEEGNINWYSPTDLTSQRTLFITESAKKITELGLLKSSAKLFPPYSVMMTSRATIGEISINRNESSTNQGFITLIPNDTFTMYQLYFWLKTNMEIILSISNGSTFKEVSKTNFKKLPIVKAVGIDEFTNKCDVFFKQIESNILEIEQLINIKDYILPRLLSGEIKLTEVEEQYSEVIK